METKDVLKSFKDLVIGQLNDAKERAKTIGGHSVAQAIIDQKISVLESFVVLLHKQIQEGFDMERMKSEIRVIGEVSIDDLMVSRRGGVIEPQILEVAKKAVPGKAYKIDPEGISYQHFDGRVRDMVHRGVLSKEFKPAKRGKDMFLCRLTKEQMKASEEYVDGC